MLIVEAIFSARFFEFSKLKRLSPENIRQIESATPIMKNIVSPFRILYNDL